MPRRPCEGSVPTAGQVGGPREGPRRNRSASRREAVIRVRPVTVGRARAPSWPPSWRQPAQDAPPVTESAAGHVPAAASPRATRGALLRVRPVGRRRRQIAPAPGGALGRGGRRSAAPGGPPDRGTSPGPPGGWGHARHRSGPCGDPRPLTGPSPPPAEPAPARPARSARPPGERSPRAEEGPAARGTRGDGRHLGRSGTTRRATDAPGGPPDRRPPPPRPGPGPADPPEPRAGVSRCRGGRPAPRPGPRSPGPSGTPVPPSGPRRGPRPGPAAPAPGPAPSARPAAGRPICAGCPPP